eukprot:6202007-Pleurochrysis_carterae.AAC.2
MRRAFPGRLSRPSECDARARRPLDSSCVGRFEGRRDMLLVKRPQLRRAHARLLVVHVGAVWKDIVTRVDVGLRRRHRLHAFAVAVLSATLTDAAASAVDKVAKSAIAITAITAAAIAATINDAAVAAAARVPSRPSARAAESASSVACVFACADAHQARCKRTKDAHAARATQRGFATSHRPRRLRDAGA